VYPLSIWYVVDLGLATLVATLRTLLLGNMLFVIIKNNIRTCDVNFAGGTHALTAMAAALAAAGHRVHLLYCSNKAAVFQKALLHGFMASLRYSQQTEGVIRWTEASGVTTHVSLTDVEASYSGGLASSLSGIGLGSNPAELPTATQRIVDEATGLLSDAKSYAIVDNDGCSGALFQTLTSRFQRRLLLFVQNIHFLPFGPQGTAPRTPGVLNAWSVIGGILCVSHFVAAYIQAHTQHRGVDPNRIHRVGYNAWRTYGSIEEAQDFSNSHSNFIRAVAAVGSAAIESSSSGSNNSPVLAGTNESGSTPVIGMLKLTPEKGAALFLALARQLPQYKFVAVTADQALLQQQKQGHQSLHHPQVQAAQQQQQPQEQCLPSNVTLIEPVSDLNQLLQHVHLVLAPSFWQEAFGMVVVDAMLRGVPVITSDLGGLPEAGLGVALQLPVVPLQLPVVAGTSAPPVAAVAGAESSGHSTHSTGDTGGYPRWEDRQIVPSEGQPVGLWAQAVQQLLGDGEQYERAARVSRAAAVTYVLEQEQELQAFMKWLTELEGMDA
jgi:glycosyltransferase involved in cell wall biosynthesis